MNIKSSDLVSLFERALAGETQDTLQEIGIVVQVGDAICKAYGLSRAVYGELVTFAGGNRGIILSLQQEYVDIFLFSLHIAVSEQEVVRRTGTIFKVPVGQKLLGRVIDALGNPIDGLGPLSVEDQWPVEAPAPGIIERSPVNQSLRTGMLVVDALVPIGKGQRELLIGNRSTGKTAVALDIILNQKGKNVFCIYVSIGQRQGNLARIINTLEERGALEYTIILSADASDAVLNQYLAPYVGTTMGEYLRAQGRDVLIVYDDLSNHAIAYREMSLLLRRPPGREAFPGDVFYLHSRLLERAGKLAAGGSITALPIVQIQSDDITAYIPTNLISITDGQIFLDTHLFNTGIRPAVNVELSVSRVGSAAQAPGMKKVTKALRLELAQYHELLDFSQFGAELDIISQKKLERGKIAVELLKQEQYHHYSLVEELLVLFLLKEHVLDGMQTAHISPFVKQFVSYVESVYPHQFESIEKGEDISGQDYELLQAVARDFKHIFVAPAL